MATWRGVVVGMAAMALLTALKVVFAEIGTTTPFLLYFGAVVAAAWVGTRYAGLVVTIASALTANYFFIGHAGQLDLTLATFYPTAFFVLEGLVLTLVTSRLRESVEASERAQAEAKSAQRKLEAVLSGVDDGITMIDATGQILYANEAAARLNDVGSVDELVRMPVGERVGRIELWREDGSPLALSELPSRAAMRGESPPEMLVRYRTRPELEEHWSQVRANAVREPGGTVRFVVTVFRDITEKRRQDTALAISRQWFETVLRSIGDAVITTDRLGRVTFLNPIAIELTGWTTEAADGRPLAEVFDIVDETSRRPVESPVERVLREGVVVGLANHTVLKRRDGIEVPIDDSAAPIKTADGALVGVVLVFRDVTVERRDEARREFLAKAASELASSLDYQTTLATVARLAVPTIADWCAVDMLVDGAVKRLAVAHVDPRKIAHVVEVEKRYPPDPNAATGIPNILRTGRPEMMTDIPAALLEAAAQDAEHLEIIRALSLRSYVGVPIVVNGRAIGVITLVMAESNRRYEASDQAFATQLAERAAAAIENATLYREAEALRVSAEAASRSKDEFLAMLGHELRNPLAPIVTALRLMRMRSDGKIERERDIIERQVTHLVRLVDDLLDVSRIAHGRIELAREVVELSEVVARGLEIASPLVEQRAHEVTLSVAPGLLVYGDPARLGQVVANLVNNAAKYTERGGHLTLLGQREGPEVVLRVLDDGIGIAPEMLPRVFDLFMQTQQALDRAQGGLGLGLSIVRSLVMLHGGTVEAKSDGVGKGCEMIVRLPPAVRSGGDRG